MPKEKPLEKESLIIKFGHLNPRLQEIIGYFWAANTKEVDTSGIGGFAPYDPCCASLPRQALAVARACRTQLGAFSMLIVAFAGRL